MAKEDILLEPGEKISLVFQASPKMHISMWLWYAIGSALPILVLQYLFILDFVDWNIVFYALFLIVLLLSEYVRQNSHYYITDRRIIRSTNLKSFQGLKNYYLNDFSEAYVYTTWGRFFGYNNLHLCGKEFINNFFNHILIRGLDKITLDKIYPVLEMTDDR